MKITEVIFDNVLCTNYEVGGSNEERAASCTRKYGRPEMDAKCARSRGNGAK